MGGDFHYILTSIFSQQPHKQLIDTRDPAKNILKLVVHGKEVRGDLTKGAYISQLRGGFVVYSGKLLQNNHSPTAACAMYGMLI
jgi:hypothetical protein